MAGSGEEASSSDCFVATTFAFGACSCGCGTLKLVGFDENGVARAMITIEPDQFVRMAMVACEGEPGVKETMQ